MIAWVLIVMSELGKVNSVWSILVINAVIIQEACLNSSEGGEVGPMMYHLVNKMGI